MKIIKTMLLVCLLGGSAGTWAMEQKEEQKSQYDNSPRQQTTEIQKSKDGKDVTVFGRKTFYGFTAEELKEIPLVQALEKYDLDFTRIKRERVPEGTDLGQVVRFEEFALDDMCGVHMIVEEGCNRGERSTNIDAVIFGTKVLGYSEEGKQLYWYNFDVVQPLLESSFDNTNQVLKDFIQKFVHNDYYTINFCQSKDNIKKNILMGIIYKKIVPTMNFRINDYYSDDVTNPFRNSYNPQGKTYEDRHRENFPSMNLPVSPSIIENFIKNFPPLLITKPIVPYDNVLNQWKDELFLTKERGFRIELYYNFLEHHSPEVTSCLQEIINDLKDVTSINLGGTQPKPLKVNRIKLDIKFCPNSKSLELDSISQKMLELIPRYRSLYELCGKEKNFTLTIYPHITYWNENHARTAILRDSIMQNTFLSHFVCLGHDQYGSIKMILGDHKIKPIIYQAKVLGATKMKSTFRKDIIADALRLYIVQ